MSDAKIDPVKRLATALVLRGMRAQCVGAWGTHREVVVRLVRSDNNGVRFCWGEGLSVGMRHLQQARVLVLDGGEGVQRVLEVEFDQGFVLQLRLSDQQTAQEMCTCLNAVADEVRSANANVKDRFAALEIQLVMKQEQLLQFHEFLKKRESCHRIAFLLQGASHRHKHNAVRTWTSFVRNKNIAHFHDDRRRWQLHAVCNARENVQAWYHATFWQEVYREPSTFWCHDALMYPYEHQLKKIRTEERPADGNALQRVLCTDGTTYADVAAQMYIMKAILSHSQYQQFQHLATEGLNIVKHPRKGWPGSRPFRLSFIEGEVYITWNSRSSHQGIPLRDVRQLSTGIKTPVLHRSGSHQHSDRYLSLVTTERSLDLCFDKPVDRALWQDIFQTLIDKENNALQSLKHESRTNRDSFDDVAELYLNVCV